MASEKAEAAIELPSPPAHLSPEARALWRQVVATMSEHHSLGRPVRVIPPSAGRLALLTTALEARDRATEARRAIEKDGLTSKTESTGAIQVRDIIERFAALNPYDRDAMRTRSSGSRRTLSHCFNAAGPASSSNGTHDST